MKVGDLIRCGEELGVILDFDSQWLNVFWEKGDIEGISVEDVDEVISEGR